MNFRKFAIKTLMIAILSALRKSCKVVFDSHLRESFHHLCIFWKFSLLENTFTQFQSTGASVYEYRFEAVDLKCFDTFWRYVLEVKASDLTLHIFLHLSSFL